MSKQVFTCCLRTFGLALFGAIFLLPPTICYAFVNATTNKNGFAQVYMVDYFHSNFSFGAYSSTNPSANRQYKLSEMSGVYLTFDPSEIYEALKAGKDVSIEITGDGIALADLIPEKLAAEYLATLLGTTTITEDKISIIFDFSVIKANILAAIKAVLENKVPANDSPEFKFYNVIKSKDRQTLEDAFDSKSFEDFLNLLPVNSSSSKYLVLGKLTRPSGTFNVETSFSNITDTNHDVIIERSAENIGVVEPQFSLGQATFDITLPTFVKNPTGTDDTASNTILTDAYPLAPWILDMDSNHHDAYLEFFDANNLSTNPNNLGIALNEAIELAPIALSGGTFSTIPTDDGVLASGNYSLGTLNPNTGVISGASMTGLSSETSFFGVNAINGSGTMKDGIFTIDAADGNVGNLTTPESTSLTIESWQMSGEATSGRFIIHPTQIEGGDLNDPLSGTLTPQ